MKKFENILICTDLDGTLLSSNHIISKENLEAVEYFKSEGGFFTFMTGRVPSTALNYCDIIKPNVPFGCINGGGLYDYEKNKYIHMEALTEDALDLVEFIDENVPEVGIQLPAAETVYFCKYSSSLEKFRRICNLPDVRRHYREIDEPVSKVLFADENEENLLKVIELLNNHPKAEKFDFIRSEKELYEILPKGASKGTALIKLAEYLNTDKTIAVGDYDNDVEMIKNAKIGFAVANASQRAKDAADFITVSNDEHAIAKIINDLDSGEIKI